jgi:phospholipase C
MANALSDSLDSRRDFLKKAALLAARGGMAGTLAASIQRAFAIDPAPGTTFSDAEHVVILMQENRSFDHLYGTLQGVRGFNDPRAVTLPNGNPVWLQTNGAGETYAPFHLDLKNTNATWMGELPHGRGDQGEARNNGKHDKWLIAKIVEDKAYTGVPLTLGYYGRADLPFYYGLADAFTVCDQAFCSVIGPTTPNRLHLWTGTVRPDKSQGSKAHVQNEDTDFGVEVGWKTFPERLEERGISWKNYQNELAVPSGLEGDSDAWLSNFGDNPLEYFTQYGVYFSAPHRQHLAEIEKGLARELAAIDSSIRPLSEEQSKRRVVVVADLGKTRRDMETWSDENFSKLSVHDQNLHVKAFATNRASPDYRELATLHYKDGSTDRQMQVPKGDVLHQFREDVRTGSLPTVSWIIPPERYSDHPSNPWYGALFLSETLDILTQDPAVWRKTIFILCYDENDGYFDHIPPFVPPRSDRSDTGKASAGIDTSSEHVREDTARDLGDDGPGAGGRDGPIGLGFRVPLVVASPWSRGGYVCSQVFDHTSVLRFLETFFAQKSGNPIRETNISDWRRTICGDLSSAFRPFHGEKIRFPVPLEREAFLAEINQAQYRPVPSDFRKLGPQDVEKLGDRDRPVGIGTVQEPGVRPSCALPYDLSVDGGLGDDRRSFAIRFRAGNELFGARSAGAPFRVYAPARVRSGRVDTQGFESGRARDYAVAAGDQIEDLWALSDFESGAYLLHVHGPNGFFREFGGNSGDPLLKVGFRAARSGVSASGDAEILVTNLDPHGSLKLLIEDPTYGCPLRTIELGPSGGADCRSIVAIPLARSFGWYDLRVRVPDFPGYGQRFAGRVETGREGFSDPHMGNVLAQPKAGPPRDGRPA